MSISNELGRLTASRTLEKCGLGGNANRPGGFLNPAGVPPGGGPSLQGTQPQRQQAMENPVSRQQYIQQAKQREQQRMAGKGIDNTPGSPALLTTAFNASPAGAAYRSLTNPNPTNSRPGGFLNPGGVRPGGPTFQE